MALEENVHGERKEKRAVIEEEHCRQMEGNKSNISSSIDHRDMWLPSTDNRIKSFGDLECVMKRISISKTQVTFFF